MILKYYQRVSNVNYFELFTLVLPRYINIGHSEDRQNVVEKPGEADFDEFEKH